MGCDGCLREGLWENGARCGPVFAHTMRKEVASSLQTLQAPRTPPSHTRACIPHHTFSSKIFFDQKTPQHSSPLPSILSCLSLLLSLQNFCFSELLESEPWNSAGSPIPPPPCITFPCWVIWGVGDDRVGVTAKEVNSEVLTRVLDLPHAAYGNLFSQ